MTPRLNLIKPRWFRCYSDDVRNWVLWYGIKIGLITGTHRNEPPLTQKQARLVRAMFALVGHKEEE